MEGVEPGDALEEWHIPISVYMYTCVFNSLFAAVCIVMSAVFSVGFFFFGLCPITPPSIFLSLEDSDDTQGFAVSWQLCVPSSMDFCLFQAVQ